MTTHRTHPDPATKTGYPPGLLQDDSKKLSRWLAGKPDARLHAREAAAAIAGEHPESARIARDERMI